MVTGCHRPGPGSGRTERVRGGNRWIAYRLTTLPVTSILRSQALSEPRGFDRALVGASSDRILGFTAFAPEAGEVMTIVQVAIAAGLPYTALRDAILTNPMMAEGLDEPFEAVKARTM
jgi:pyruvate/2-oxoglutarate dehydrogenase complex dihydrolipoamide dehydrogenase (E3) component